jgi:hypothetical protein
MLRAPTKLSLDQPSWRREYNSLVISILRGGCRAIALQPPLNMLIESTQKLALVRVQSCDKACEYQCSDP